MTLFHCRINRCVLVFLCLMEKYTLCCVTTSLSTLRKCWKIEVIKIFVIKKWWLTPHYPFRSSFFSFGCKIAIWFKFTWSFQISSEHFHKIKLKFFCLQFPMDISSMFLSDKNLFHWNILCALIWSFVTKSSILAFEFYV